MPEKPDITDNTKNSPEMAQDGQVLFVEHPTDEEIPALCMMGRMTIPGIAGDDIVRRVVRRNADSLFGIFKTSDTARDYRILLGFYANLLLSESGLAALKSGDLDPRDPEDEHMVPLGTRPAAIYSWAVMAPGLFEKTVPMLAARMGDLYADLPILTSAATDAGKRTIKRRGFATDEAGLSTYDRSQDAKRSFKRIKT